MAIYEKVKTACAESNISVNKLEEMCEFSRGSIYKWNEHKPSIDKVYKISKTLEKPIDYFIK